MLHDQLTSKITKGKKPTKTNQKNQPCNLPLGIHSTLDGFAIFTCEEYAARWTQNFERPSVLPKCLTELLTLQNHQHPVPPLILSE